jgi:hypothetical protein
MNVGESVVLVRGVGGLEEGTHSTDQSRASASYLS